VSGFIGSHKSRLDGKGRFSLPISFRASLTDPLEEDRVTFVCYRALDARPILECGPRTLLDRHRAALDRMPLTDPRRKRLERRIFGTVSLIKIDGEGRGVVPDALRNLVNFGDSIFFVGQGERFEIWDAGLWEQDFADDAEHLGEDIDALTAIFQQIEGGGETPPGSGEVV
jgi:MraZ protein